jgi:hypothetical protein
MIRRGRRAGTGASSRKGAQDANSGLVFALPSILKGGSVVPKAWSAKDERQYEHVKASEKKEGKSEKRAKEIAARTVNKERKKEGRTKT